MPKQIVATFRITAWDAVPSADGAGGQSQSRATVRKVFEGPLEGESVAEVLMCLARADDPAAGAGYVASEIFDGALDGRRGTFALQHGGLSGSAGQRTFGSVVPGTGTGELAGLAGEVVIAVSADGAHTLTLDYDLT